MECLDIVQAFSMSLYYGHATIPILRIEGIGRNWNWLESELELVWNSYEIDLVWVEFDEICKNWSGIGKKREISKTLLALTAICWKWHGIELKWAGIDSNWYRIVTNSSEINRNSLRFTQTGYNWYGIRLESATILMKSVGFDLEIYSNQFKLSYNRQRVTRITSNNLELVQTSHN